MLKTLIHSDYQIPEITRKLTLGSAVSYSEAFSLEETGFHANKITRDREAILGFSPVGVWSAPMDLSPTRRPWRRSSDHSV